jgi:hypothetical protein
VEDKSQDCPIIIYGGKSGTGTGLVANTSVLPFQYDFTNASFSASS